MPSILPGYEYDIFISYRHKDNRSGWVSEFVEHLTNEIEATFKQEISIYFDTDPHVGLHDTHDVDGSLERKLKCLVFIPIVSHTYCDSTSFACQKAAEVSALFLVHGELEVQQDFNLKLQEAGFKNVIIPKRHETHRIN